MKLKKFTTKSFIDAVINDISRMNIKDVEMMFEGIRLFKIVVDKYMKERHGSTKRQTDLMEYEYIIGQILMAKYREREKELQNKELPF